MNLKVEYTLRQAPLVTWLNCHAVDMSGLTTSQLSASLSEDWGQVETAQLLRKAGPPALSGQTSPIAVCG